MTRSLIFVCAVAAFLATPSYAQQFGGLRVTETDQEGVCRDETAGASSAQLLQKQMAVLQEMKTLLGRMTEIRKKLAPGLSAAEARDIDRELARMSEKAERLMSELNAMTESKKKNP